VRCPLLALSGHTELHWHMSAFGGKADIARYTFARRLSDLTLGNVIP
jgi:hypothetical protein